MREVKDFEEWRLANKEGEYAATILEAQRQQKRIEKNGVAHSFRQTDVCGGGKRLEDCDTAVEMTQATTHRASELARSSTHADEGVIWTVYTDIGSRKCTACGLLCELAIQTNDGEPTGVTRFSNVRPLQNILTVQLDLDIRRQ